MIRNTLKAGIKRLFGVEIKPAETPPPPAWRAAPAAKVETAPPSPPPAAKVEVSPNEQDESLPAETPPPAIEAAATPQPEVVAAESAAAESAAPKKGKKKATSKKAPAEAQEPTVQAQAGDAPAQVVAEIAAQPAVATPPPEAVSPEAAPTDTVGAPAFSMEQVQELFDEMVRPALQGDGGDIKLVKIENNDIYVQLVGSCQSCPSSVLTMKMGVEALLKEELPGFGALIQIE